MPKITGISMLKMLKNKPQVIIYSAYEKYALESYELDVADYLLKPYSLDRFYSAIQRLKKKQLSKKKEDKKANTFFTKADKKHNQLRFDEVDYVEGYGQYCKIHYQGKIILTLERLSSIEELLPFDDFLRVHKSYSVSVSKIRSVIGNLIELANAKVPIGQSYRKSFKELMKLKSYVQ